MSDPLDDIPLVDQVVDRLTAAILDGSLPQGAHLSEPKLARELGTSRGPLREAIQRLQERRLVTRTPRQGARVITLSTDLLRDLFAVREALEGVAAREAARTLTEADAESLHALIARHARVLAGEDETDYSPANADQDFHVAVVACSHNSLLQDLLTKEYYPLLRLFRAQHKWVHGRAMRALTEHRRIVEAITERDPELAEYLMRRHIAAARSSAETVL